MKQRIALALVSCLLYCPLVVAAASPDLPDQQNVVAGNNAFAIDLYHQLALQQGNLFVSPASISTCLAMVDAGADGDTAAEMAKTMHFDLDQARLHPAMAGLLASLKDSGNESGGTLSIANGLWVQQDLPLLDDFKQVMHRDYEAGLNKVDFAANPEAARVTINRWVASHTKGKITDLLAPEIVTSDTGLILTNAVYFKNKWAGAFDKALTTNEDFKLGLLGAKTVPFMHQTEEYGYYERPDFQALALPYKDGHLSMIVLLPRQDDGLHSLEQSLDSKAVDTILKAINSEDTVDVTLPSFKITKETALKESLAKMGMVQAFDAQKADFFKIADLESLHKIGRDRLFVSAVVHKAYIDVDEEGTEAAAATAAVIAMPTAANDHSSPPPPVIFRADHPFLFLIRDNKTNAILFMGRITDPSQD